MRERLIRCPFCDKNVDGAASVPARPALSLNTPYLGGHGLIEDDKIGRRHIQTFLADRGCDEHLENSVLKLAQRLNLLLLRKSLYAVLRCLTDKFAGVNPPLYEVIAECEDGIAVICEDDDSAFGILLKLFADQIKCCLKLGKQLEFPLVGIFQKRNEDFVAA